MMKPREKLRARRVELIERAARERDRLGRDLGEWQRPLRNVDRGLAVYRGLKRAIPVIGFGAGVGMAALAFIRPEGIGDWVRSAAEFWRLLTEGRRRAAPPAERAGVPAVAGPE